MRSDRPGAVLTGLPLADAGIPGAQSDKDGLDQADHPVDRSRADSAMKPHEFILFALGPGLVAMQERPFIHSVSMPTALHPHIPFLVGSVFSGRLDLPPT